MTASARATLRAVCVLALSSALLGCSSDPVPIAFGPDALSSAGNGNAGPGNNPTEQPRACLFSGPWPKGGGLEFLIDDFSDGNESIPELDLRNGTWSIATDGSQMGASRTPEREAIPMNGELHVTANLYGAALPSGGYGWGAAISVFLNAGCPYDASNYAGITFRAKGRMTQELWVQVAVPDVIPQSLQGGTCPAEAEDEAKQCNNKHHKVYRAADLGAEYQTYTVLWSELKQGTWGYRVPFTPNEISYIEFAFPQLAEKTTPASLAKFVNFDVTIDDVKFIPLQ